MRKRQMLPHVRKAGHNVRHSPYALRQPDKSTQAANCMLAAQSCIGQGSKTHPEQPACRAAFVHMQQPALQTACTGYPHDSPHDMQGAL